MGEKQRISYVPLEDMTPLLPLDVLEREMGGRVDPRSVQARQGSR